MKPSLWAAVLLAAAAAAVLPALAPWGVESGVAAAATGSAGGAVGVAWAMDAVGKPLWAALLAVAVGFLLWWRRHGTEGVAVVVTVGATLATVQALKAFVSRARPSGAAVAGMDAFPSGHAAAAAVLAVVAVVVVRRLGRPGLAVPVGIAGGLWALAMGWSRLVVQAHRLGDVLAGLALGASFGLLAPTLLAWLGTRPGRAAWRGRGMRAKAGPRPEDPAPGTRPLGDDGGPSPPPPNRAYK